MSIEAKSLRIVYMGTPDFAVEPLRLLVERGYNVVAVVTVPDKPAGRGLKLQESAVKKYALSVGLEVLQPEKLKNSEWIAQFTALKADIGIVVAFRMLPEVIWSAPRLGTFNLHASLLPRYRGAAPINWAIINGDTQSGATTFFLNHKIDCGAIIDRCYVDITEQDTAGTLHDKLMYDGAELVVKSVQYIANNNLSTQEQPQQEDILLYPSAPKIFKDDCKIDWTKKGQDIYNKIRGLSPYPAAWCDFDNTTAKLLEARFEPQQQLLPAGTMESDLKNFIRFSCTDGWIYIDSIQVSGKKRMEIREFLRGFRPVNKL